MALKLLESISPSRRVKRVTPSIEEIADQNLDNALLHLADAMKANEAECQRVTRSASSGKLKLSITPPNTESVNP